MRKILLFVGLVLIAGSVFAQVQPQYRALANSKSYAASQNDTLAIFSNAGSPDRLSIYFDANDSVSVKIIFDKRPSGGSWTVLTDTATITSTANGGVISEYVLRDNATEKVSLVHGDLRVRPRFQATGNGVSSAVYSLQIRFAR